MLAQNLKFILTGERRRARSALLADWLRGEGDRVDLLLLSEARLMSPLEAEARDWCFYTQLAEAQEGYRWAPISAGRPPGGLALGVRRREAGVLRSVGGPAGRRYRARPTSLAEGFLGKLLRFEKGWAGVEVDGTQIVWSHTQASYKRDPATGAGGEATGRAGQFEDLADDLGRPDRATLLTGDLNLLAGFSPSDATHEPRVAAARAQDDATVTRFRARTGIDLTWPWEQREPGARSASPPAGADVLTGAAADPGVAQDDGRRGPPGTFAGRIDRRKARAEWDVGAPYDRVGVNGAFLARHPDTRVRRVEIRRGWMGVSDHLGLEITIPFARAEATPERVVRPERMARPGRRPCGWAGGLGLATRADRSPERWPVAPGAEDSLALRAADWP